MIRVGTGGWSFKPWEASFYPKGLSAAKQLGYASAHVTSIEINSTFYRTQAPTSFEKWASETPQSFVFSVKAPRYTVNRKLLGEGGALVESFLASGLDRLGPKLGPILWQLAPTKKFDAEDIAAFLKLMPKKLGKRKLRHALEVRHDSFRTPAFVDLVRKHGVAIVYADSDKYPAIADLTADFVYARLQCCVEKEPAGYSKTALDEWAKIAREWESGGAPSALAYAGAPKADKTKRDVFLYFIAGAKVRAPLAAMALIDRLR